MTVVPTPGTYHVEPCDGLWLVRIPRLGSWEDVGPMTLRELRRIVRQLRAAGCRRYQRRS